ncbi:hypothetical protein NH340_JMT04666 [Sarcoptes scabiei]|nr:hypothetical protein NH340_JMT04666 [Sarcoptes scabiei]
MPYPKSLEIQPSIAEPKKIWKEAASLLILAYNDTNNSNESNQSQQTKSEFDYKLLMVKRSSKSSFFASAYVFPGGQIETSDFDYKWYNLFEKCGIDQTKLDLISTDVIGPRPPIVSKPLIFNHEKSLASQCLNTDIALRISAIRETFEEAGILLLTDPKKSNLSSFQTLSLEEISNFDLVGWQEKVRGNSSQFYELCNFLNMVPDVWNLYEWSNWLTPVNIGHKRFDTIFYICCFNRIPSVFVDNAEVIEPIWCDPNQVLAEHQSEQVFLAPPQVYELSRILNFRSLEPFQKFIKARQVLGTQRWMPIINTYDDGAISLLPGDELYPEQPELITSNSISEIDGSVHEINKQAKIMNRLELQGIRCRTLCNIEPGCGQLRPINYPLNDNNVDFSTKANL